MTFSDLLQFYHKIRNMFRYFKISMRSCFSNWTPMNVQWCVHDACIMPVTWLQHLSGSFTVVSAPIDQTILSKIAVGQDLSILCSESLMDFCQWQLRGSLLHYYGPLSKTPTSAIGLASGKAVNQHLDALSTVKQPPMVPMHHCFPSIPTGCLSVLMFITF